MTKTNIFLVTSRMEKIIFNNDAFFRRQLYLVIRKRESEM